MAAELARYGVPVRIVDKAPQRSDKSKALVLWSRTLELLDRGPGAARFIEAGFRADAVNIIAGDKLIGRVGMGSVDSPFPFGLMIPQADTERLLDDYLGELGVAVERGVEVSAFSQRQDGVDATLLHSDGREETMSANWLIGCDGAHSMVRHSVNAPFTGETMDSDWMLADLHMRGYPCPDSEASVYWHKDGVFVIFPISPGRYRVIADLPPSGETRPPRRHWSRCRLLSTDVDRPAWSLSTRSGLPGSGSTGARFPIIAGDEHSFWVTRRMCIAQPVDRA
jgi:2-polyprenyl-6-methoxyphenol hydroxylase-like FAD-dependent oxidoreductase